MLTVYLSALLLGLGSSFHCLGMCGPLVMAVPMKASVGTNRVLGMSQYFLGKTFTYAVLGLLVGFLGISIQTFKWMQILSVISGILIIAFAWGKFSKYSFGTSFQQVVSRFTGTSLRKLFQSNIPFKPLFFGMINGLLPCGLVYIALFNSLLAGGPFSSTLAMVFFGVGTIPVLTLTKWLSTKVRWKSNRWTPVFITLVGAMIIFRGLNLGVPYLSPKINTSFVKGVNGDLEEKTELKCCTKDIECEKK